MNTEMLQTRFDAIVGARRRRSSGAVQCRLGEQVWFNHSRLTRYCVRPLEPVDVDLLTVAGVAAFADRYARRHRAHQWHRSLELSISVHEPERWKSQEVSSSLIEALEYLTGDRWTFHFVQRPEEDGILQFPLSSLQGPPIRVVLPYSGGLDSYAGLRETLAANERPFLITTEHNSASRSHARTSLEQQLGRCYQAGLPVELSPGAHPEPTYRSRTFLFYSVAALAWKLVDAEVIIIPEAGQGVLGPSLVPTGDEQPYRSTHPAFTKKLGRLLRALWNKSPRFEHPHLWMTKAAVLKDLNSRNLLDDVTVTHSCAFSLRRKGKKSLPAHCGICAGCILRRSAIRIALKRSDGVEEYVWNDLNATTLARAVDRALGITTTANDRNIAYHGALVHQYLADVRPSDDIVEQTAFELAEATSTAVQRVRSLLHALVDQHRVEWLMFLDTLQPASWIRQLVRGQS